MHTISLGFNVDTAHTIVVPVGDRGFGLPTVADPLGLSEILIKAIAPVLSSLESWGHKRENYKIILPFSLYQAARLYVVNELPYLTVLDAVWQVLGKFNVDAACPPSERAQAEMDAAIGFMEDQVVKWKTKAESAERKVKTLEMSLKTALQERQRPAAPMTRLSSRR